MKDFADDFVKTIDEGIKIGMDFQPPEVGEISNVIMCGLGGSGVCGDMLVDVANFQIPIIVVKDYNMPKFANEKSLVFCISYSGNTEETLSQFMQAKNLGCKVIAVTSNGKLKEWAEKLQVPVVVLPTGYRPRDALALMFFPILVAVQKLGLASFEKDFSEVKQVVKEVKTRVLDDLANRVKNSRLAVYGTSDYIGILRRIKNDLNENAKMTIMYDYFPELNHNEMTGYQRTELTKNVDVIFLRDKFESEEMKARIETTKNILEHYVNSISELWAIGNSILARSMSLAFMGIYLSFKIAEITGVNREKVPFVERLKEVMGTKLNTVKKLEEKIENPEGKRSS